MYQGNTFKFGQNITELGGVSLQKLTPGRNIEKEILNRKIASFGTRHRFLTLHFGTRNDNLGSQLFGFGTCFQLDLSNGGNGSQCFTAKPHRAKSKQIGCFTDL